MIRAVKGSRCGMISPVEGNRLGCGMITAVKGSRLGRGMITAVKGSRRGLGRGLGKDAEMAGGASAA